MTSGLRRVSNDTRIRPPSEPHPVENTLLFLPEYAVGELLLEPNMSDKGDTRKELWFGRVWELRELLRVQHDEYLARVNRGKPEPGLTAADVQALDAMLKDPKKKSLLTKLCARWKGTAVRRRNSLRVLNRLKYSYLRGTVIYAHGSGGCSWDNFRICRMMARMGMLVIAPDGFAYPKNTDLGKMRHKDVQPLKRATDEVDYWADDLVYSSGADGSHTYSTKADSVLDNPDKFRDLYERCYQMRRRELHWTIEKLPRWIRTQGFFIGGTSEGAMTVSRFDDGRYGHQVLGRFINSFSIEYCYFTPKQEDAQIGGNKDVPTLNIIGTKDEYFGGADSVAALVQADKERGFGDVKLDGHGFDMMMEQELGTGLVCYMEGGKHGPCPSHDNFLRRLFQTFFTRPRDIWRIADIWANDERTMGWLEVKKQRTRGQKLTLVQVPVMDHSKLTLEELDKLHSAKKRKDLLDAKQEEDKPLGEHYPVGRIAKVDIATDSAAAPRASLADSGVFTEQRGVTQLQWLLDALYTATRLFYIVLSDFYVTSWLSLSWKLVYEPQPSDMGEAALDLLQSLEEDLQIEIIEQFDIQGCPCSSPGDFALWQPMSTAMSVLATAEQELEQKEITKAASSLSQCTTLAGDSSPGELSPEILTIKPEKDVENALEQPDCHAISIWTRKSIGVVIGGFLLAFLTAICSAVTYGFFLGYMGLDSYVMSSITQLMKLPQVLLLPFGILTDCCPIRGKHRKPYFLLSWCLAGCALLAMSLRPLPAPFYCQNEDGSYNFLVPPCNPGIHTEKNWYVFWMFILTAGIQLGITAGEGLLLEYSQREPVERRGQIKAEMTMVSTGGALAASVVVGVFMNSKAYLGTFDWGLSFSGLMALCFVLVVFMIPLSVCCVHELPKPRHRVDRISCGAHVKSSWELVQKNTFSNLLFFAFLVQLLFSITTTAGPMVKSRWAEVKVLQQQTFGIVGLAFMMLATWIYKVCLLQTSWRKTIFVSIVTIAVFDAIPTFLTIFNIVRNQYFYLGEDILGCIPMAALQLVANLMIIELAEPGREGLCYGLIGTFQSSSTPFGAVVSNQIFGLFNPKLSKLENYVADTSTFRSTVAWSYVLTYSSSLVALFLLPMIPFQKEDAQRRKKESGSSSVRATLVIVIPAICLIYGIIVLLLTSQEETACLQWIGGQGTRDGNVRSRFLSFVRGMWCRRLGVNREVTEFLRDLPEDIQVGVLKEFDPRGTKDGNVSARLYSFAYARSWKRAPKGLREPEELEAFVHHWQLEASARQ
ncbi:unnamed protein product, partial [Symbiodinium sp. CCMP2456]